jgi:hypothetical protein
MEEDYRWCRKPAERSSGESSTGWIRRFRYQRPVGQAEQQNWQLQSLTLPLSRVGFVEDGDCDGKREPTCGRTKLRLHTQGEYEARPRLVLEKLTMQSLVWLRSQRQ